MRHVVVTAIYDELFDVGFLNNADGLRLDRIADIGACEVDCLPFGLIDRLRRAATCPCSGDCGEQKNLFFHCFVV